MRIGELLAGALLFFGAVFLSLTISSGKAVAAMSCSTSGVLSFGVVDVLSGAASPAQPSTISIICTGANPNAVSATVCLSIGAGQSTSWPPRQLISGPKTLLFEIYKDSSLTTVMGSWSAYVPAYSATTTGLSILIPITSGSGSASVTLYGSVLGSQQSAGVGTYTNNFTDVSTSLETFQNPNLSPVAICGVSTQGTKSTAVSFSASATVQANCSVAANNLNFGNITSFGTNIDAQTTMSLTCSNGLPYTVGLSGGSSGATDPTQRKMHAGSDTITYGLYSNSARSAPWGDLIGTNTVAGTGNASAQSLTIFGRVYSGQTSPVGSYSDVIAVTVTY
ncbi:spore coat protein U domain-containing protein [Methylosinus sporium]|uniref:Csu type fimbrial protein n=1 Tax=Methylosinus sporium TaxID=428 RepID=UPI00383A64AB